jgi:hypothetical protein
MRWDSTRVGERLLGTSARDGARRGLCRLFATILTRQIAGQKRHT